MPLYLTEADVKALLSPADAVEAVKACCLRTAAGAVENLPRRRLPLEGRELAVMAAADLELGYGAVKSYTGVGSVVLLFDVAGHELAAVLEAHTLSRLRTGAASAVAARHLSRAGAHSLGVIGCGRQAVSQVACIRSSVPSIERVVAYCRTPERLRAFCAATGAESGESPRDAAEQDVVVTITTSRDPVLRGEWLRPGALVCAAGANRSEARELDNAVLERAAFVCCDSLETARLESGDLIEPVAGGVLDWLEVHELHEVVSGAVEGRHADADIVVFKSNGIAAWDAAIGVAALERARERGVGREL